MITYCRRAFHLVGSMHTARDYSNLCLGDLRRYGANRSGTIGYPARLDTWTDLTKVYIYATSESTGTQNTIEGRVAAVSYTTDDLVSLGFKAGKNYNVERSWTPSTRHKRCVLAQRVRFRRMKA